jgi:N-acetylmuramic acid 6-phosphate etherase
MSHLLALLGQTPSPESQHYVTRQTQFHLHSLETEQRHRSTWNLSFVAQRDVPAALRSVLEVDRDIERRLAGLIEDPVPVQRIADAVADAVLGGRRVYVYGCGATGRLAKQMESSFWRPFWRRALADGEAAWTRALPDQVHEAVVGEMTGGDRALVSSLEGFEDLKLLGALQLEDHRIESGDVVICVTEGGETSSVIGTAQAARALYDDAETAQNRVFFIYNNPDDVLRPFDRSREIHEEPVITRLNLTTGPQAISGSTRMQATSIETFVVGIALEDAIRQILAAVDAPLEELGFTAGRGIAEALADFAALHETVRAAVPALAPLTEAEAGCYTGGHRATYLADAAMVTVFTDCTERSPTFRLYPLDRVDDPERRCWVQIWTPAESGAAAWQAFLGRPFRGLDRDFYGRPLDEGVDDPYLHRAAQESLANAGADQEARYDFSFSSANVTRSGPGAGDLGVVVAVDRECLELGVPGAPGARFRDVCAARGASCWAICAGDADAVASGAEAMGHAHVITLPFPVGGDPLGVRRHIAVKILLNAHSTTLMARLGRTVGNTMTNVSPSNLKLVGRATFLIQSHVRDVLGANAWHPEIRDIDFAEANAVLYDAIGWVRAQGSGQTAEVALSIVRILETVRSGRAVRFDEAAQILDREGLAAYLARHNPDLDG